MDNEINLRGYNTPSIENRKKYGEVLTPISIVEEMLDTLPDAVWLDANKTWCDPCAGVGIFSYCILKRLEKHHSTQHILENMIYAFEIQEKHIEDYKFNLDPEGKYNLNIKCGSFLEHKVDDVF